MTHLTLIRHGQAQTGAADEASYDKLSPLGHQQANWLGDHLKDHHAPYDRIISGAMRRQIETAQSMGLGLPHEHDARLNEIDYFGLAAAVKDRHNVPYPTNQAEFEAHIESIMLHWSAGDVGDEVEPFDAFMGRIESALREAHALGGRTLLVTSTGVIASLVALALKLDRSSHSKVFLEIAHTSKHRISVGPDRLILRQYGALPHLETDARSHAVTYI